MQPKSNPLETAASFWLSKILKYNDLEYQWREAV